MPNDSAYAYRLGYLWIDRSRLKTSTPRQKQSFSDTLKAVRNGVIIVFL